MTQYQQAADLPAGWVWVINEDQSGHLQSPDGKTYFSFDWATGEYQPDPATHRWDRFVVEDFIRGGYSIGSFSDFQHYAEKIIKAQERMTQK
jgi:hypothetical protein